MQRRLSSFDIYVIVSELQKLKGSYIDKIYQLTRSELLIRIKNIQTKEKESIYIRNGDFLSVTQKELKTPQRPAMFAMALRKYLQNGRITEISQHEFDRIIIVKIGKKEGEYSLVIEFFSDGNIILTDPEGKIILPLIRQAWAHRSIQGREPYTPPPSQINPFNLSKEQFTDLLKESNADIVRTLAVNVNLSGPIAEEICIRGNIDKKLKIDGIEQNVITRLFESFTNFLGFFKERKFDPVLVKKDGEIVDILPFKFESYTNVEFANIDNLSNGLENFIEQKIVEKKTDSKTQELIGKLNRQLAQQQAAVTNLESQIKLKKLEGDLIYLNYQEIEELLSEIKEILDLKEKEVEIKRTNEKDIVKKFDPLENLLILNLKDTSGKIFEIKINFRKTVSKNAEKAYDDNKKLRSKKNGAEKSAKKTKEQIILAKDKELKEKKKEEEKKQVKKVSLLWFEKYRWFISSDGNIVIGGKDAKSNELVVKKYLKEGDRYAHADIQGASSIIIKSKGIDDEIIEITEKTLGEACIFAASYSKAWKQFAEAQAYWVLPEQVSKSAQSGEFVPKGAFIIRGKRNYHRCKLEIAVGEIDIQEEKKIMAGPVEAIQKRAKRYVVMQPGGIKKNEIAKKIAKAFDVNVDSVDRVLPAGGVTVIESEGVEL
ncbi:MAG: NFACT family protein [Thermoplasmatales archaeon]|nr:NFACT family protein [Thermoplasmatales archaeon]